MAATAPNNLYLSPDQQDLLLAALTSNSNSSPMFNSAALAHHGAAISPAPRSFGVAAASVSPATEFPLDYAADWDGEFNDDSWDYDLAGEMMHDTSPSAAGERAESKRKEHPHGDSSDDPHDMDPKRRGAYFPPLSFSRSRIQILFLALPFGVISNQV